MGSMYRSEEMTLCQLFLQAEAAYACVSELGELGLVQFRDVGYLEKEIRGANIDMVDNGDNPDAPAPREMIDLEATFEKLENEVREIGSNKEALRRNFVDLTELKEVLKNAQTFFDEAKSGQMEEALGEEEANLQGGRRLGFVAGMLLREKVPAFEKLLWRACRGNVFLRLAEVESRLEDPVTGDRIYKSVFIVFFQGDQLKSRVVKICEGFRATLYPCPETQNERKDMATGVFNRIEELNNVLNQTQDHRHRVLVTAAKNIKDWFTKVRKIKAIYHTLNLLNIDVTQKCLICECWCPVQDLDKIQMALTRGTERSGSNVPSILNRMQSSETPPTYNKTNKFTKVFQAIVDAYGVASYLEVNPAPFSIISFPFLFSLMYGDVGHGVLMSIAAFFMVLFEKKIASKKSQNEIWNIFFGGRYVIFLMGAFSIYSGFMYNDCLSKSFKVFPSSWSVTPSKYTTGFLQTNRHVILDPANNSDYSGSPYPFGMDPVWVSAENKITWLNSYKMKLSLVFGVAQMLFGLILSLQNHRFRKDNLSILCDFIPQLIFMLSIFGYLIILIFYKFLYVSALDASCAPSLLIGLINMFLMNYPTEPCSAAQFYAGQKGLQIFLLLLALLCVPWLLILKPVLMKRQHDKVGKAQEGSGSQMAKPEEFKLAEVVVRQCIHTIEYCLSCISHTASYLRLWALSLAHAELSEVLWSMVLRLSLKATGASAPFAIFIMFAPWFCLTITILLLMEALSAFLHALRLHWVEFQSKFYSAEGYLFDPFSFDRLLEAQEEAA